MADTVVRLKIRGAVQGVGYRWSMVEHAQRLNIGGWVRNRRDGSVEAVVAGAPDDVERIVTWARHGPAAARVHSVAIVPAEGSFHTFEQRPTE